MEKLLPSIENLLHCSHRDWMFKEDLDKKVDSQPVDVYQIHECEDIRVWHRKGRTIQRYFQILREPVKPERTEPVNDFERELAEEAERQSQEAAERLEWETANLGEGDETPPIPF